MPFSDEIKRKVWKKARTVPGHNEDMFRKDACGAWIMWDKFGRQDHAFGWEIDHIYPKKLNGTDVLDNLRPLQHQNNASKADDYPSYTAVVTAVGDQNIYSERNLTVNASLRELLHRLYNQ